MTKDWIDLSRDLETGIETLRAHFKSHAYEPHWHDSYLVGVTEQGLQQFNCRRIKHSSTPGIVIMIEPCEIHDGNAPQEEGFTYRMLYIDPKWIELELNVLFQETPSNFQLAFESTLVSDTSLAKAIAHAFQVLHLGEIQIVKETALDILLEKMTKHLTWRSRTNSNPCIPKVANLARDYIHSHLYIEIGLNDLAKATGTDRFRLTRAFKGAFGMAPYQYLIQLRLAKARQLLAKGAMSSDVAAKLCFSDQSHLGRWFKRAYRLTPSNYRRLCTNLLD